jgi:hypothetical protein
VKMYTPFAVARPQFAAGQMAVLHLDAAPVRECGLGELDRALWRKNDAHELGRVFRLPEIGPRLALSRGQPKTVITCSEGDYRSSEAGNAGLNLRSIHQMYYRVVPL